MNKLSNIVENAVKRFIIEKQIADYKEDIDIEIVIDKTKHAGQRQFRHKVEITDNAIIEQLRESIDEIIEQMIFNHIDIGEKIVIRNHKTNLNIVVATEKVNKKLKFIVITVMRKEDFKVDKSQHKIIDLN